MNTRQHSDPTVEFYDRNAAGFGQDTGTVDMHHLYSRFLPRVRKGGTILDAGCGVGRDAAFFKQQGFAVEAFDASQELAVMAGQTLGQSVKVMTFLEFESLDAFDGIWACASLLHVPSAEMDGALRRLARALKVGCPMYMSFKYGITESQRNGRLFNDYDEAKLKVLLERHPTLVLEEAWQTPDARPGRQDELWLNAIVKKR